MVEASFNDDEDRLRALKLGGGFLIRQEALEGRLGFTANSKEGSDYR